MRLILSTLLISSILGSLANAAALVNMRQVGSTQIELSVNKSIYALGESVHIRLSVNNQGTELVSFQFPTGQMCDFVIERVGQRIWQWSDGRVFTQAFTTLTIRSGESKVFNVQWDQRDGQGRAAPPGEYELMAVFPAQGRRIPVPTEGPRVRFRIGGEAQASGPKVSSNAVSVGSTTVGEVVLDGRPVLRIRTAAGGLTAIERAEVIASRLRRFLDAGLRASELRISRLRAEAAITWRGQLVVTADATHARLNRTTPSALASQWHNALVHALSLR